ncbi:MAG TPA: hypothetical protein VMZ73_08335 [Acidimicrobiales bacterium]|nr:hypothetical protein [Acidimicrobiales bacterium]
MRHEEFLDADRRRLGPAVVLGYGWKPDHGGRPLRVVWLPGTGELYVAPPGGAGEVEVLAVFAKRAELDVAVSGWNDWESKTNGLAMLRAATAHRRPHPEVTRDSTPPPDAPWARSALPAEDFRKVVAAIVVETGEPLSSVAESLDLDTDYVASVMRGDVSEIEAHVVKALSETLVLAPEDIWGGELGASINWIYGGELSPAGLDRRDLPAAPEPRGPEPGLDVA